MMKNMPNWPKNVFALDPAREFLSVKISIFFSSNNSQLPISSRSCITFHKFMGHKTSNYMRSLNAALACLMRDNAPPWMPGPSIVKSGIIWTE
jgi:hypothetical protein